MALESENRMIWCCICELGSLFNGRCWCKCKIKRSRRGRSEELAAYVTGKTTTYKLPPDGLNGHGKRRPPGCTDINATLQEISW